MFLDLSKQEISRYSRHLLLPDVGKVGQKKLKAASVLIIGTGGLGSPVALYLAAAGVGRIGLVDYDVVEESNLQRQVLHGTQMLGKHKVDSAFERLNDLNPGIKIEKFYTPFTSHNAMDIAAPYDLIIDCSDNFPTRYLTNDLCVLTEKPNIYGAVFQYDGQASVFNGKTGPCYRCLFPEPPPPGVVPTCNEAGVLGVLPGTIGTIQATEAIKLILGLGSSLVGRLILYDLLELSFETVTIKKNPNCRICGNYPDITHLIDYDAFCGVPDNNQTNSLSQQEDTISVRELKTLLQSGKSFKLIDVREPHELTISWLEGAQNIPVGELASHFAELDKAQLIVLFCRSGSRSQRALGIMRNSGFVNVKNLLGGINAWAREVDTSLPVY